MNSLVKILVYLSLTLVGIFTWGRGGWLLCLAGLLFFAGIFTASAPSTARRLRRQDSPEQPEDRQPELAGPSPEEILTPVEEIIRERQKQ